MFLIFSQNSPRLKSLDREILMSLAADSHVDMRIKHAERLVREERS